MATEKQELIQLAVELANRVGKEYSGRWCFFAGFAFVLNGVEKRTYDIDVVTKDQETYQHIKELPQQMGLRLAATTKDFSSFRVIRGGRSSARELTLDLLCITSEYLKPLKGMWTKLEDKQVEGTSLPVLLPIYLILLKILVNSHRQAGDRKKEQDFVDIRQLMAKRRITASQIKKESADQGLVDITCIFLDKLKSKKT
jgi:hypothetical protein